MQIIFNIAKDSNVEIVKGEYELIQGECCVTELKFNFPATIKGVAIGNYKKRIEFGECKDLGECAKFIDDINGDTYELDENCTAFKKIMVQLVLTYNNIKWKTLPVALEFHESVNAEGATVIQAQLLSLSAIEREWENYIKANTFRVISRVADIPPADASSLGEAIFYLSANTDTAPYLVYGHYYKCNYVNGAYEWTDLTQDASLAGVADGVREINKNQTLQFWIGTAEELENEVPQENVAYIAEDKELKDILEEALEDIVVPKAACATTAETVKSGEYSVISENSTHIAKIKSGETGLYVVGVRIGGASGIDYTGVIYITDTDKDAYGVVTGFIITESGWLSEETETVGLYYSATRGGIVCAKHNGNYFYGSTEVLIHNVRRISFTEPRTPAYGTVTLGTFVRVDGGYSYYKLYSISGVVPKVGDILIYNGEEATITADNGTYYEIKCLENGAFASSSGEIKIEVVQ